jgi:ribonuclease VapC
VILDSSAVVAILMKEASSNDLVEKLLRETEVGIGSPTLAETAIVLSARLRVDARGTLARFVGEASVIVVPFGEAHYSTAVDAWLRFGKGRHPASLNFGDCLSYAIARVADRPLLCTGDDFAKTDLDLA